MSNYLTFIIISLLFLAVTPIQMFQDDISLMLVVNDQTTLNSSEYLKTSPNCQFLSSVTGDFGMGFTQSGDIQLYNTKVDLVISLNGGVFTKWTIKGTGYDLGSPPEFSGENMYTPMDILPDIGWNGENYRGTYNLQNIHQTGDSIQVQLSKSLSNGMIVNKIYDFLPDRADLNITETIENPTESEYNITSLWNPDGIEGFMVDIIGHKREKLAYRDDSGTVLDSGLHWQWLSVKNLQWLALYEDNAFARVVRSFNNSNSIYGEWTSWNGKVARISWKPYILETNRVVSFKYNLYGGSFNFQDLINSGLEDFYLSARGPEARVNLGESFVIEPNTPFNASLVLNSRFDPIANLTVNHLVNNELLSTITNVSLVVNVTETIDFPFENPRFEGTYQFQFIGIKNGLELFRVKKAIIVIDPEVQRHPVAVNFVFHHHQPWYVNEDGNFIQPFAQSFGSIYYQHVEALNAYPRVHITANLQPCLLDQWNISLNGYSVKIPGEGLEAVKPDDERVQQVARLLMDYAALAKTNRLEILTSPYFHPILAILGNLGFHDDGVDQIRLGIKTTRDLVGINPSGLWSPEQTFNQHVVKIINQSGISYTILDDRLLNDSYPGYTNRVPYILEDPLSGLQTTAFFRDSSISNNIAFNWNGFTDGDEAAREFLAKLTEVFLTEQSHAVHGKIHVTLALDGENWITENNLLERMYEILQDVHFITSQTLLEQLAENPPIEKLDDLREGSWGRGTSLITWQGTPAKDWVWDQVKQVHDVVINANSSLPPNNSFRNEMIRALYLAEGSDYTFWEESIPTFLALFAGNYANKSLEMATQIVNSQLIISPIANGLTNEIDKVIFNVTVTNPGTQPRWVQVHFIESDLLYPDQRYVVQSATGTEITIQLKDVLATVGTTLSFNVTLYSGYGSHKLASEVVTVEMNNKIVSSSETTPIVGTFNLDVFLGAVVLLMFFIRKRRL
jgi:alpha-amylase/alpha-mannosidase (GH57 family)